MTSNLGSEVILGEKNPVIRDQKINELLRTSFKPEFINRIDEVVIFDHLSKTDLDQIILLYLDKLNQQLHEKGLQIELTPTAKEQLLEEGYDPDYGARPMKRVFQKRIQDLLAVELLKGNFAVEVKADGGLKPAKKITLDFNGKTQSFFVSEGFGGC